MTDISKNTPAYFLSTTVFFFVIFSTLIIYTLSGPIGQYNVEAGDFAANSLLIQQAKQKLLLVGNYSRVGF
ncbi:MAG: hypothetical protein KGI75_20240, partial [Rhizobiaceae bacterium]|nr:hypothetical protein [Rhizobiaceae bacterium]